MRKLTRHAIQWMPAWCNKWSQPPEQKGSDYDGPHHPQVSIDVVIHVMSCHMQMAPTLATMADAETSEAKRAMTVPLPDGLMMPSTIAMFPAARLEAFDAAGVS